ncbi:MULTISPECIES: phospho-sugar mutase [unclassified Granulicatella]|uniref:phospho-sugar mutase n=1 Tax=unclassified Granulicatella TaxID=2630493 RepID=UPI00107467B0|nr:MULTISPECIES: phospho-sugar mutase [unclassified Granulicatella]MBF0779818.1 phospho-sugar mutase [Granulicatella sp. 19428wC4_WM01]TFU96118.1 phospho-sugar mutase [Granulicatella sp. WM01]
MNWENVYHEWKNFENLDKTVKESLDNYTHKQIEDAFYEPLSFGTAGMRGQLGAGINRMNIYTVRQATKGLALFMESVGEEAKQKGVAIAYDSRHQSAEFALEAAKVLGVHGIPSYLCQELRPTPELSFAVRHFQTFAGIMITASHNPAEYNGYKVYGSDGGQMPPQDADALTTFIRSIDSPLTIDVLTQTELEEKGLLHLQGEQLDKAYLDLVKTVTVNPALVKEMAKEMTLVFTPLHGAGKELGEKALKQAGFESVYLVKEQAIPDGNFSTVALPNPEDPKAFEYAIALGKETSADVLIATDPDADRLGAAVKMSNGEYRVITGNQIASLMLDYLLNAHIQAGTLPKNGAVAKSIVSSELPSKIAAHYQVEMVNVLTGFKFIADKIKQYESDLSKTFLFGFEESYGYLVKPFVRDKDAIQALVLLAEVAAYYKKKGQTLYDGLQAIYEKYGYFLEETISVTLSGIEGVAKIQSLMAKFRKEQLKTFGQIDVSMTQDFKNSKSIHQNGQETSLDMPSADVLKYILQDGSWVAIRPSGTEPKIKFYIGVCATTQEEAQEKLRAIQVSIDELLEA